MKILCGDIGGTKVRLAVYTAEHFPQPLAENCYASHNFSSLTEIVYNFISDKDFQITHAVFGLAGPVSGRYCKTTNLPWEINADKMERDLHISSVHLINDLEATAYGISALDKDDYLTLQSGLANSSGNRAIIAAGTGLGQAGMFWDGTRHIPFATEGGHCDFSPSSELEFNLLTAIKQENSNVSWEDILSGPGLESIYSFLLDWHQQAKPGWFNANQGSGAVAEKITNLASDKLDQIATEALELFSRLYGAEAGNLALKHMATGGIYLGGGIAPKITKWLQLPLFLEAFCQKGKMQGLMQSIPVQVILNDRAALYGPAIYLKEILQQE